MRFGVTAAVCTGLLLMVAGCDQADRVFFKKGIGTELNSGDIEATTKAQDAYVADICRQAGLIPVSDSQDNTVVSCGPRPDDPATWQLFVQAGMNDIDQRCDAYLAWLDYVRRSKEPTLSQLAQASTATTVIMDRAGVGAGPIAIAAAAFGFAIQTFTNVTSRLILEVNHSTVQAVVLSHQKEYREDLLGSVDPPVVIASKPAAIYALRSYLRLCMPMTIETQINNIMTTFSRGGTNALDAGEPMITAKTVGLTVITNPPTDSSYWTLRNLLMPGGAKAADPKLLTYIAGLFGKEKISAGALLNNTSASLRTKVSDCIRSNNKGKPCEAKSLAQLR